MRQFIDLFKPPVAQKKITDSDKVDAEYRYWRIRVFLSIYIGYTLYYFMRKSLTSVQVVIGQDLGLHKADLGTLGSILAITYGISKFGSGLIGDRCNARYFMSIGLILTGIFNILFGMSSSLVAFAIFWGLNGIFQGWGWPPSARIMTHWFSRTQRGTWWGVWSTAHAIGAGLIMLIGPLIESYFGWRWAFYLPGTFCILGGCLLIYLLRDTPESLGLPSVEVYSDGKKVGDLNNQSGSVNEESVELTFKQLFFTYVLNNRYIWILAFAYFFIYILRQGINDWTNMYLVETKGFDNIKANSYVTLFEAGGFLGTLLTGWISDYFFRGYRIPLCILFAIATILPVFGIWNMGPNQDVYLAICVGGLGFFIYGPQMLIGLAAAELSHKKAAATATGFVGAFAYAGAFVAGWPMGGLLMRYGWNSFFQVLVVCGIAASLLLFPLWSVRSKKHEVKVASTNPSK